LILTGLGWFPPRSGASNKVEAAYDSGLQTLAENTSEDLVVDTNDDSGRADFIISVGALGNASGTPLDGSHNVSFGESNDHDGMVAHSESDSSTSYATPVGYDASDPEVIAKLLTQPPKPSANSPTSTIQFNEQVLVTEYSQGGTASTTIGNLGGANNNSPTSSLPGSDALRQHANAGNNPNRSGTPGGVPNSSHNSGDSNGGNGNGKQGRTSGGNDPQDSGPNANNLNKILLACSTVGGPLEYWAIQGAIRVDELFQFSGARDPNTNEWVLQCKRNLIQPEIVDRVSGNTHFAYQHNRHSRVRTIIDGMTIFVHSTPSTRMTLKNSIMLRDNTESTQVMCRILGRHLAFANALPRDRLPLGVPLQFYSERMHAHPHGIIGSFDFVRKVNATNAVVIPCGVDDRGMQIVEPPAIVMPAPLPAPTSNVASAEAGTGAVSNEDVLQAVLAAMRTMTQVQAQSDQRNACMSQQQARLQRPTCNPMLSNSSIGPITWVIWVTKSDELFLLIPLVTVTRFKLHSALRTPLRGNPLILEFWVP